MGTTEMVELFANLWKKGRAIEEQRKAIAAVLLPKIKALGKEGFRVGQELVQLISNDQKRPCKQDIEKFFGQDLAGKFWKKLKPKKSEYLTVVPAVNLEMPAKTEQEIRRRGAIAKIHRKVS